ncbi:MAG: DUF6266 family protein [Candidatus Pedobacter colombiensis]|uniref:DUF6266 family protein n=1 Tax=Candidatus Pedobacter colombiensis TaxID=3121371 RepID=A0AAJ5W860_9SPHI|nr:DUF6266 family protein [Pedobacter sp.]WEK18971.1 MAG: DUF6266 family protein [Pedobacter sp.]
MGIINNGLHGPFKGRIDNTVYYMLKNKNVSRQIGINTKPPSELQLRNRLVTKLSSKFMCALKDFIETGFGIEAKLMDDNAYNQAIKHNKSQIIEGTYPDLKIAYPQVILSKGLLKPAEKWEVTQIPMGLQFTWQTDPKIAWPEAVEQVMMLAYFPDQNRTEYMLFGNERISGSAELELPPSLQGKYMETYLSFIAADRKQVANSVYTGSFNKPEVTDHLLLNT